MEHSSSVGVTCRVPELESKPWVGCWLLALPRQDPVGFQSGLDQYLSLNIGGCHADT